VGETVYRAGWVP